MASNGVARFADFEFDLRTRELRRKGRSLDLEQKPAEMLRMLVERPGELVTRAELQARLWPPDIHLDFDHALNKTASKLRDALHDNPGKPRFVETLTQRGYRFIALVERVDSGINSPTALNYGRRSTD
ncbi:MAG: winged helix-turn-helix domain-containing protein [Candidatus Acidiferrales bacterium]